MLTVRGSVREIILDSSGTWFKKFSFTIPTYLCLSQTNWDGFAFLLLCRRGAKLNSFLLVLIHTFTRFFLFCPLQNPSLSLLEYILLIDAEETSVAWNGDHPKMDWFKESSDRSANELLIVWISLQWYWKSSATISGLYKTYSVYLLQVVWSLKEDAWLSRK